MNAFRFISLFVSLVALAACGKKPGGRFVETAFYHWQTVLKLSPAQIQRLDSLGCRRLYVKALDLGVLPETGEIAPFSQLEIADSTGLAGRVLIPCVFITNQVFQRVSSAQISELARKVLEATGTQAPEIQIDCDWTATTQQPYFEFLREIKKRLPPSCRLSATIRLHQYKFPKKTGVPPVDRGMLMLYNTGDIDDPATQNSIFDPADARKYIAGAPPDYPLPLDVALPLFSWALVYRHDELWKIWPDPDTTQLNDTTFFRATGPDRRTVVQETFRNGLFLRPGDQLRIEKIRQDDLSEARALADRIDVAEDAVLAYFHL